MNLLSLGGGVQSTTLLLMALRGEGEPLDGVLFADTGWEPRAVYRHIETLEQACNSAGLPFYRVSAGNIKEDALNPAAGFASMPLHIRNERGRPGMLCRQCTSHYKIEPIIEPIQKKVRELLGAGRAASR